MNRKITVAAFYVLLPVAVLGTMMFFNRNMAVRNLEYPNQMAVSPAYRSQSSNPVLHLGVTAQPPVAGTIPRGFMPFHYGTSPEEAKRAGRELTNPFKSDEKNLERGKYVFTNNCAVCHGAGGAGDGPVIPEIPEPAFIQNGNVEIAAGRRDVPRDYTRP